MHRKENKISYLFSVSFAVSVALHFIAVIIVLYSANFIIEKPLVNPDYVMVETNIKENKEDEKQTQENVEKEITEDEEAENEDIQENISTEQSGYLSFIDENADTTLLEQLYSEQTLNVRVMYPAGWQFIDQNNKGKLDGVTFWAISGSYNPPPYIHLEVKDKYLFSESRYQFRRKMKSFTAYYNEPEELSGQVSQEVYCRTESKYDFSIKLIMEGRDQFKSFQPRFFGMIKSFKFGKTLF